MASTNEVQNDHAELEAPPPMLSDEIDAEVELEPEAEAPPPKPPTVKILGKQKLSSFSRTKEKEGGDDGKEEKAGGGAEYSKELLALKTKDHIEIKEWLEQLSAEAPVQIVVSRREPKVFADPKTGERKKVDGMLAKYDRVISEDEIQQNHGGGTFQLRINVRNKKGNWNYFSARTLEIAGDPRLDDVHRAFTPQAAPPQPQSNAADPVMAHMMSKTFDFMAQQASVGSRMPHGPSSSEMAHHVQMAIAPLQITIQALTDQLANKDREMAAIREHASKGDPYKDKLLDKMLDTDNARIQTLRTQHESEIRMLKEQQVANENRIRDQFQRDIDRMERAHEREVASIKASAEIERRAMDMSTSTTKTVLDSEVRRLEKQVTTLEAEVTTLRNRKEPSLAEKIKEMNSIKDLVGGDEPEESSTLQKVIEAAGNLPIVAHLAEKYAGGGQAQQQQVAQQQVAMQQAQPQRPRKMVRDKRTGAVLAPVGPNGELVPVQRIVPTGDGNAQVAVPPVDPATVKVALDYMTSAFQSGTKPEDFADSARPMIPSAVIGAIRALGIDEFMSKVAQLDGTSPLATQGGRNWRRRVANRLLGEVETGE